MLCRFALCLLAVSLTTAGGPARADTFGVGANAFTIDFVNVGQAGNAAHPTGYGAVDYDYRMGKFEISQNQIDKATASGLANVTAGAWVGDQPAADISWYEAAAFVNWLNVSTGRQAAYDLAWSGTTWTMSLWSSADAWQVGGENLYRHKDAYYFLPSEDEWYKAAYYNPSNGNYFVYPTGSNVVPAITASGTEAGTAVFGADLVGGPLVPAPVNSAGGLSPYGTMGQGGNVVDWLETASTGTNNSPTELRVMRGGNWASFEFELRASERFDLDPNIGGSGDSFSGAGFRVASVPEPSTYALLLLVAAGATLMAKRK